MKHFLGKPVGGGEIDGLDSHLLLSSGITVSLDSARRKHVIKNTVLFRITENKNKFKFREVKVRSKWIKPWESEVKRSEMAIGPKLSNDVINRRVNLPVSSLSVVDASW
jgi:hypothetical protein